MTQREVWIIHGRKKFLFHLLMAELHDAMGQHEKANYHIAWAMYYHIILDAMGV